MKTITGLFDSYSDAKAAVSQLEAAGVPSDQVSIVSHRTDGDHDDSNAAEGAGAGAGIGALAGGAGGLLTGIGMLAIPGVGPVVAAGWLVATLAGAAAGAVVGGAAGGLIGAFTSSGVSEEDAHVYAEGVRRGGSVVTARVEDALAPTAESILDSTNRVNVLDRRTAYNEGGWTRFDDTLDPYSATEVEAERNRYRGTSDRL